MQDGTGVMRKASPAMCPCPHSFEYESRRSKERLNVIIWVFIRPFAFHWSKCCRKDLVVTFPVHASCENWTL